MLQSMRESAQSTPIKILIFLIVVSFAGFGVESVLFGGSDTSVAEVNGVELTPQQLQVAVDNQRRQLTQTFGDGLDPAILSDERLRALALERLIERQLLLEAAADEGVVASNRAIGKIIAAVDAFKVDGKFSPEQYKIVLANAGYSPEGFRHQQMQQIMLNDLQQGVFFSEFITPLELGAAVNVIAEERDVRYLTVPASEIIDTVNILDTDVVNYYNDYQDDFFSEAKVIAEYIELKIDDFLQPVDEAQIREQFEILKDEHVVPDRARVAHILLTRGDDESEKAYSQRIDNVAARLAAKEDFSVVAMEVSDDIGSVKGGGDLGFTNGSIFPEEIEVAIAELEVGEISTPLESDAGIHFIRVEERLVGEKPNYEELRAELEESIQRVAAEEELLVTVEALRDLAFNSDELVSAAETLEVLVHKSTPVSSTAGEDIFALPTVRDALFSDEVFILGNNSQIIELSDNHFVVVRVDEKIPSAKLPFEEVEAGIRSQLEAEVLDIRLEALLSGVRMKRVRGDSLEAIAKASNWEWRVRLGAQRADRLLPREVVTAAFAMNMELDEGPALNLVELPEDQYAIVELARVQPGDIENLSSTEVQAVNRQLRERQGERLLLAYRLALRSNAEIVIH